MGGETWELEVRAAELRLASPFRIATATWDRASNVFVMVRWGDMAGIGEASPDERSGESIASVERELKGVDLERLAGPYDLDRIAELLPAGSARCALDIALHDLAAKLAGISVSDLLGLSTETLPVTSLTLPIDETEKVVMRAADLSDHPVLKMKVGFDGDVEAVAAVRDVFSGSLRIDANEGWTPQQACARLEQLEPFDIELCEQPIARGRHDELRSVTQATPIPIFADEDVCTAADVGALIGVVDGVNVKLRKSGGIREAWRAIATARALGMGAMLGCDLTSGVCSTAEARLAALVDHADVDGPTLLAEDPYPGVRYERGRLILPPGPGLGVAGVTW